MALYACMVINVDYDWQFIDAADAEAAAKQAIVDCIGDPGIYSVDVRALSSACILKVEMTREVRIKT